MILATPKTTRGPRTLGADTRGSMFVEMVALVPVLILIGVLLHYIHDVNREALVGQARARSCAWRHAMKQCKGGMPADCRIESNGQLRSLEFAAASQAALPTIAVYLPLLIETFREPHGKLITARNSESVARPGGLGGGDKTMYQSMSLLCDAETKEWEPLPVYFMTCIRLLTGSSWCVPFL